MSALLLVSWCVAHTAFLATAASSQPPLVAFTRVQHLFSSTPAGCPAHRYLDLPLDMVSKREFHWLLLLMPGEPKQEVLVGMLREPLQELHDFGPDGGLMLSDAQAASFPPKCLMSSSIHGGVHRGGCCSRAG